MEDHLLAVQFILIQSGGRAEQRVNAAHIHILSTPWGRTHRHTLHAYIQTRTHTLLRKHTLSFVTGPQAGPCIFLQQCVAKCNFCDLHVRESNLDQDWWNLYIEQLHVKESGVSQHEQCAHWLLWPERQFQSPIRKHQETEMGHVCQFV